MERNVNSSVGVGDDISRDEINQKLNAIISLYISTSQEINVPKNCQKWARPAYIVFADIGTESQHDEGL
jgi:hypothetical protein